MRAKGARNKCQSRGIKTKNASIECGTERCETNQNLKTDEAKDVSKESLFLTFPTHRPKITGCVEVPLREVQSAAARQDGQLHELPAEARAPGVPHALRPVRAVDEDVPGVQPPAWGAGHQGRGRSGGYGGGGGVQQRRRLGG